MSGDCWITAFASLLRNSDNSVVRTIPTEINKIASGHRFYPTRRTTLH